MGSSSSKTPPSRGFGWCRRKQSYNIFTSAGALRHSQTSELSIQRQMTITWSRPFSSLVLGCLFVSALADRLAPALIPWAGSGAGDELSVCGRHERGARCEAAEKAGLWHVGKDARNGDPRRGAGEYSGRMEPKKMIRPASPAIRPGFNIVYCANSSSLILTCLISLSLIRSRGVRVELGKLCPGRTIGAQFIVWACACRC